MEIYHNDQIDRIGISYCENVITKIGLIFREQPIRDYGIDAQIETINPELAYASGKLVAAQIKTGHSYFSETKNGCIIFRGENKHYDYWLKHSLPVILILYNPNTGECIWEHVNPQTTRKTQSGWLIEVPRSQKLCKCKRLIEKISENLSDYEKKLHTLILAKPWMNAIINGDDVILEADEWINKSSGRGSFILKIIDSNENEKKVIEWPYVYFGLQSYEDVFRRLFPWAAFHIDDDFYYDYEEEEYKERNCHYDNETDEYLFFNAEEFEDWRNALPDIRSYSNSSGEVDHYRLKLTLNRIGDIFIELDTFLENELFYNLCENDISN